MSEPIAVGALLTAFPGLAERLARARVIAAWPAIAGPAAPRSRAERLEGGCLHVAVDSSGWLHRLTLEESALLERCRAVGDVRTIRFHLAPIADAPVPAAATAPGSDPDAAPPTTADPRPAPGGPAPAPTPDDATPADEPVRVEGEVPR